jgi:predicted glycoside hydrolase/deacetylase ChbG (UPF0249 family)
MGNNQLGKDSHPVDGLHGPVESPTLRSSQVVHAAVKSMRTAPGAALLINADDFGLSSDINAAIALAFRSSLITNCSIMPNAPAFEEAVELAHTGGLAAHTGIHFVLDEGEPLTGALRGERRFCDSDGRLRSRKPGKLVSLTATESRAVAGELRAQIARCRSSGLDPTHVDSHHHIHEDPGVIRVMLPVMREQGIRFIRPMQNLQGARTLARRLYTLAFNASLTVRRIAWTQYFGAVADFLAYVQRHGGPPARGRVELMVHPAMSSNGTLIDRFDGGLDLFELVSAVRAHCNSGTAILASA